MSTGLPDFFVTAVRHVFGEWSALKLAVENEWGGHDTRGKALALLERTLQSLNAPVVHRDEIEMFLDGALMEDFSVEAEDESPRQVAEVLCLLHTEARAGATTTADALAARATKTWVDAPLPPGQRRANDDSSDDDEGEEGEEGDEAMDDGAGGGGSSGGSKRPEPVVDDDGFQMVTRSKSRGGR
tara:strand:- start:1530 stop:2084 length:555 start_codon:yes stop_codon:yes gene_type:complete